jgi:Trypsin-like peptidase domain
MPIINSLVAVCGPDNIEPVGAGFLLGDRLVATCAHVVNAALGRHNLSAERPVKETVALRFCFSAAAGSTTFRAHVAEERDAWKAPPAGRATGADFCLLELDELPPSGALPAELGRCSDLVGRSFEAVGFPEHWDFDAGMGTVVGEFQGLFLLRPKLTPAFLLRPIRESSKDEYRPAGLVYCGFSGGPVFVDDAVVGMVVETTELVRDVTAYMLPITSFPSRLLKGARRITPDEAIAVRLAEPSSPNAMVVANYLKGIASERDPETPFIERFVVVQPYSAEAKKAASETDEVPKVTLDNAVRNLGKLILLGEPGLGKSTALKHLEIETAAQTLSGADRSAEILIPIVIDLKNYRGELEFEEMLAARVNEILRKARMNLSSDIDQSVRILKAWLNDPSFTFLILLDAMDELPPDRYDAASGAFRSLLNLPHRMVISCRTADYDQSLSRSARTCMLMPWEGEEITNYLVRMLGTEKEFKFVNDQMFSDLRMLNMASNPLFLSMLAQLAKQNALLPRNRGLLFKAFVDEMIARKRRRGSRLRIAPDVVIEAMSALGFEMMNRNAISPALGDLRRWPIPRGEASLEAILAEARELRFLRSDGSSYQTVEFVHLLWAEYFAAEHLKEVLSHDWQGAERLMSDRIDVGRWREVIVMLVPLSGQAKDIIEWFVARLKDQVEQGTLFVENQGTFFGSGLGSTRLDLLMQCWEESAVADDEGVKRIIVTLLRAVIRKAGPAMAADSKAASPETSAAIGATQRLNAIELLPDLEDFLRFDTKEDRGIASGIWDWLLSLFVRDPFSRARSAVDGFRKMQIGGSDDD